MHITVCRKEKGRTGEASEHEQAQEKHCRKNVNLEGDAVSVFGHVFGPLHDLKTGLFGTNTAF